MADMALHLALQVITEVPLLAGLAPSG